MGVVRGGVLITPGLRGPASAESVGADLTVRVSSRETEQTVVESYGWNAYSYPWGWRRRWGFWGGAGYWSPWSPYAGDVWTHRYLEESVTIDVIERDTGGLVYRAQVIDDVGNNRDKQVVKTIDRAFKKFPIKEISSR